MSEFSINLPPRLPNAGPAPNILTAVIPDPPRQLAQLDNGTIIRGTVQGRERTFTLLDNDQLTAAGPWLNAILAYRDGAPVPAPVVH